MYCFVLFWAASNWLVQDMHSASAVFLCILVLSFSLSLSLATFNKELDPLPILL